MQVKFTHLEGYESFTWTRVRRMGVRPVGGPLDGSDDVLWQADLEPWVPPVPVEDSFTGCSGTIVQTKAQAAGIIDVIFDNPTVDGKVLLLYEAERDEACRAGLVGWLAISADVSTDGTAGGDHGRWWYLELDGGTSYDVGATRSFAYETSIDFATFDPGDVVLYESTNAGTSTTLGLGAVTNPEAGQIILYGATYDTAFGGSLPATPGAGWTLDYNANQFVSPPSGAGDQHPHLLVMRWDGTTDPLTGSATIGSAHPYAGVMIQIGEGCETPLPETGEHIFGEMPADQPNGTADDFVADGPYLANTLQPYLDGIRLLSADFTEVDPVAGDYSLAFVPDNDETLELDYVSR